MVVGREFVLREGMWAGKAFGQPLDEDALARRPVCQITIFDFADPEEKDKNECYSYHIPYSRKAPHYEIDVYTRRFDDWNDPGWERLPTHVKARILSLVCKVDYDLALSIAERVNVTSGGSDYIFYIFTIDDVLMSIHLGGEYADHTEEAVGES